MTLDTSNKKHAQTVSINSLCLQIGETIMLENQTIMLENQKKKNKTVDLFDRSSQKSLSNHAN